jgi:hypothetical protein
LRADRYRRGEGQDAGEEKFLNEEFRVHREFLWKNCKTRLTRFV